MRWYGRWYNQSKSVLKVWPWVHRVVLIPVKGVVVLLCPYGVSTCVNFSCSILMDRTSWSACFAWGLNSGNSFTGKGLVPCRKHSNRDPVWPCDETEMGHTAMLSFRMFLLMFSPVKFVWKCLSDFPVLQYFPFSPVLGCICNYFFKLSWNWWVCILYLRWS